MELSENIVLLGGSKKEYCEYGPATVYDVLGDFYLTGLSGLMGSEADSRTGYPCSFPKRGDPNFHIAKLLSKSKGADTEKLILFFR